MPEAVEGDLVKMFARNGERAVDDAELAKLFDWWERTRDQNYDYHCGQFGHMIGNLFAVIARDRAALSRAEAEREEAREALRPFAFETSPNVRFIWTHNPEALAGDYAHDNADFQGLCVLVIADPTWVSHTAVPEFHQTVKRARDVLGIDPSRLSRASHMEEPKNA